MKFLWLFCASAGVVLGSAAPPPAPAERPQGLDPLQSPPKQEILLRPPPPTLVIEAPEAPRPKPLVAKPPFAKPLAAKRAAANPKAKAAPKAPREAPKSGGVRVVVSLAEQRAYVFQGEELVASAPVSTGKRGHETPVGTFRILQKKIHHRSSKYDNAPMPYMQRLTDYGIALHAGKLPGYPASHGCIRLPSGFAKKLYGMTGHGTPVTVMRTAPKLASRGRSGRRAG